MSTQQRSYALRRFVLQIIVGSRRGARDQINCYAQTTYKRINHTLFLAPDID